MILITAELRTQLLANAMAGIEHEQRGSHQHDPQPILKLFTPWTSCTWLITEMMPSDENILFGLCDLGMGEPELGYVSLEELQSVTGPGGLKVERDIHWKPKHALSVYNDAARRAGRIVERIEAAAGAA